MSENNFHIIDHEGELITEDGQSEREAYETMRHFRQEDGMRGLKVVRRDQLTAQQQASLKDYEDRLAALTAKMRGRKVA